MSQFTDDHVIARLRSSLDELTAAAPNAAAIDVPDIDTPIVPLSPTVVSPHRWKATAGAGLLAAAALAGLVSLRPDTHRAVGESPATAPPSRAVPVTELPEGGLADGSNVHVSVSTGSAADGFVDDFVFDTDLRTIGGRQTHVTPVTISMVAGPNDSGVPPAPGAIITSAREQATWHDPEGYNVQVSADGDRVNLDRVIAALKIRPGRPAELAVPPPTTG